MNRRRLHSTLTTLVVVAAIGLFISVRPSAEQAPALERLTGVEELKSWFNAGVGHPRLIFLLSPT